MSNLATIRLIAWILVGIAAIGGGALYLFKDEIFSRSSGLAGAAIGGPFSLSDQDGKEVSDRTLRGKPYIVFFGFTHCPDVCPTAMFELSESLRELGDSGKDLRAFFVTVDPERDTPELMKRYLTSFDPRIHALTGPTEQIDVMVRAWRAFYRKVPLEKGAYTMDHTALIYLMGPDGRFVDLIRPNESLEGRTKKLRALVK